MDAAEIPVVRDNDVAIGQEKTRNARKARKGHGGSTLQKIRSKTL